MDEVYFFKTEGCVNCPATKAKLDELKIDYKMIDIDNMDDDLELDLLENQIVILSVPVVLIKNGNKYRQVMTDDLDALCKVCNSKPDTIEKEFLIVSNLLYKNNVVFMEDDDYE